MFRGCPTMRMQVYMRDATRTLHVSAGCRQTDRHFMNGSNICYTREGSIAMLVVGNGPAVTIVGGSKLADILFGEV